MKLLAVFLLIAMSVEKTFSQTVAVSTERHVFYQLLNNPLTVAIEKCACEDVIIKTSNGTLTGSDCKYTYYASDDVLKTTIEVGTKIKGKVKWLTKTTYLVKPVPEVKEVIGTMKPNKKLTKNAILLNGYIKALCPDPHDYDSLEVISYSMYIPKQDSAIFRANSILGNELPNSARMFISNNCNSGDILVFDEIICMFRNEKRQLPPFMVMIAAPCQ